MAKSTHGALLGTLYTQSGEKVGEIVLAAKDFSSGSDGFYGNGKLVLDGQKFQTQLQMVRVGSKAENGR